MYFVLEYLLEFDNLHYFIFDSTNHFKMKAYIMLYISIYKIYYEILSHSISYSSFIPFIKFLFRQVSLVVHGIYTSASFPFLYSVILTEYVRIEPRVSVCTYVCAYVRMCVCVRSTAQTAGPIFCENSHRYSLGCLSVPFFSDFENSNLMTSWRPFCT